ncbi:hypothetical protein ACXZ65_34455 [Streptomyces aculeolatus]
MSSDNQVKGTRIPTLTRPWTPPADPTGHGDIDWIAVERLLHGDIQPAALNSVELREAAAALYRTGTPVKELARRIDVQEAAAYELLAAAGVLPPDQYCSLDDCWRFRRGHGLCQRHLEWERREVARSEREAKALGLAATGLPPEQIGKAVLRSPKWVTNVLSTYSAHRDDAELGIAA